MDATTPVLSAMIILSALRTPATMLLDVFSNKLYAMTTMCAPLTHVTQSGDANSTQRKTVMTIMHAQLIPATLPAAAKTLQFHAPQTICAL